MHGRRGTARPRWRDLLKLPQTWGTIIARSFTDPVFFFIAEWFPIYLVAKGIELKTSLIAVWIPFLAADAGSFFGGAVSGYLIKRGWSVGAARKAVMIYGAIGVALLIPTIFTTNLYLISFLFAFATFSYAGFTIMANVLPSDLYHSESVASVSGLERHRRRNRNHRSLQVHRLFVRRAARHRNSFLRSDHHCRGHGSVRRNASRVVTGPQYAGHQPGTGAPNLSGSSFSRQWRLLQSHCFLRLPCSRLGLTGAVLHSSYRWRCCLVLMQLFIFPRRPGPFCKSEVVMKLKIGPVFVLRPAVLFPVVGRTAGAGGAAVANDARPG